MLTFEILGKVEYNFNFNQAAGVRRSLFRLNRRGLTARDFRHIKINI